jgi:2-polyprenyl-3-methyl-5-hydroxy-6-metoxy-1,4-benzoquinol methylase
MDRDIAKAQMGRLFEMTSHAATMAVLAVADRTGLLRAMHGAGPLSIAALAERTGQQPRYLEEITASLSAAGLLTWDPEGGTVELSDEIAACLADESSPYFMGGWTQILQGLYRAVPGVAKACEEGGGVSYDSFGEFMVHGISRANSPGMRILLTRRWLAAVPGLHERLDAGIEVADVGCGAGTAVLTMAEAYPRSKVVGFDVDARSIEAARVAADDAGLDNARFEQLGGEAIPTSPGFDLITAFDVVHDLVDPKAVLARIHEALRPDGLFFMVEPDVAPELEQNINPSGALLYAMSTLHCMTVSLAHGGEGLGAAWGPTRAEQYCREAGFTSFERLDVPNPMNAFYAVRP